jgi:hypothetical protein
MSPELFRRDFWASSNPLRVGEIKAFRPSAIKSRLLVNKIGATSGVTAGAFFPTPRNGYAPGIDQVTPRAFREQADGSVAWAACEDLSIHPTGTANFPKEHGTYFCEQGDEGALLMNTAGEVLGMVSALHEPSGWGFFTEIGDVIEDIKDITGASDVRMVLDE